MFNIHAKKYIQLDKSVFDSMVMSLPVTRFLYLLVLQMLCIQCCFATERIALVIGNSDYAIGPLRNASNDASDIARALRELEFEVVERHNVSQSQMLKAIQGFGGKVSRVDVALFYYAGHAMQVDGENFLIPLDATLSDELDILKEGVRIFSLLRDMGAKGKTESTVKIVILDACRNNPFAEHFQSSSKGLARIEGPTGSFIAYATAPGSVAMDGKGRNGVFTKHLLQAMNKPNLPIQLAFTQVMQGVKEETNEQQVPWISSSLDQPFAFNNIGEKVINSLIREILNLTDKTVVRDTDIPIIKAKFAKLRTIAANHDFLSKERMMMAEIYVNKIDDLINKGVIFERMSEIDSYYRGVEYYLPESQFLAKKNARIGGIYYGEAKKLFQRHKLYEAQTLANNGLRYVQYEKLKKLAQDIEEELSKLPADDYIDESDIIPDVTW